MGQMTSASSTPRPRPSTSRAGRPGTPTRWASWGARSWAMGELDVLRVREEVLQAMFWMRSEGLADSCTAAELARFLAVPADTLAPYLERFAGEGYLAPAGAGYGLTELG